jgi:D-alanine transfer protein
VKWPHLAASLIAAAVMLVALVAGTVHARRLETRYIHALAPGAFTIKNTGSALQKEAFRQPDLLVVYGSSELTVYDIGGYPAPRLFATYPTGFETFEVAKGGVTSLTILQQMAALGGVVRGKKVVVSFTPTMFIEHMANANYYRGSFSELHASELAFSTDLSFAVKQSAAKRMLQYPKTLEGKRLLLAALPALASGSPLQRAFYLALMPLGKLDCLVLRLQDHWATQSYITEQRKLSDKVEKKPRPIDWPKLLAQAEKEQIAASNNNPFGFDSRWWTDVYRNVTEKKQWVRNDATFLKELEGSAEWSDLRTLLVAMKQMGVHPLLLSRPINGIYWGSLGVSAQARQRYYLKLGDLASAFDEPVMMFSDHDDDKYFSVDLWSHTSREGWVYVDQALDQFFHQALQ